MRFVVFLHNDDLASPISLDLHVVEALCISGIAMVSLSHSHHCPNRGSNINLYVGTYLDFLRSRICLP
jgi:hypothetical protein